MKIKSLVSMCTVAALSMSVATTTVADDKVLLKLPVWFGTHLTGLGSAPLFFADTVNSTSVSVKVKIYEPGKLVANGEMLATFQSAWDEVVAS